jgi:hypothetical protein
VARLERFSFTERDAHFKWDVPPDIVFRQLAENYARNLHVGVQLIVDRYTGEIEQWMKSNRPWTDRTGAARAGLKTEVESVAGEFVRLWLTHGPDVEYGVWLEIRFSGKYAIISPALDHFGPKIWSDVMRMLRS